jgi:dephospho-CoA kinase
VYYDVRVLVFGLTGGIASGKSAVAARLRARGVPVVDADLLARAVVSPGSPGLAEVVGAFGDGVLTSDGALDRARLAAMVFRDEAKRKQLNAILHPRIAQAGAAALHELAASGEPLACYEAALLVENGVADAFRPLVVVSASEATQIERAMLRDHASREQVEARLRAQLPLAAKVSAADFVIANDDSLDALHARTDRLLSDLCDRADVAISRYPSP